MISLILWKGEKDMEDTKKVLRKKIIFNILIDTAIGVLIFFLMLWYQKSSSKLAIVNSFQASGALLFSFGWIFLVHNEGIFDVATYGVVYFIKGIFGKKMKTSLYEKMQSKERVPKRVFIVLWIIGLIFIGVSLIIYYLI